MDLKAMNDDLIQVSKLVSINNNNVRRLMQIHLHLQLHMQLICSYSQNSKHIWLLGKGNAMLSFSRMIEIHPYIQYKTKYPFQTNEFSLFCSHMGTIPIYYQKFPGDKMVIYEILSTAE